MFDLSCWKCRGDLFEFEVKCGSCPDEHVFIGCPMCGHGFDKLGITIELEPVLVCLIYSLQQP